MEKVAFISASLGGFDKNMQDAHKRQTIPTDFYYFTDENFPPRTHALSPRLQAKIPKMFGWEMVPGYDYYIWADAVIMLCSEKAVEWLLSYVKYHDVAFFRHQDFRPTIMEELIFMENHMSGKSMNYFAQQYLNMRYGSEPIRKQVEHYLKDPLFVDNHLYAAGLFIYKNKPHVRQMLRNWYLENAKWSVQDQLSLPYVLSGSGCSVNVIDDQIVYNKYTEYFWRNETNMHLWDHAYKELPNYPSAFKYGDTETYKIGADFLADCETVEDWGCGAGGFKRYRPDAIGIDGSVTPFADKLEDLVNYTSNVDGIFIRHVLEHDRNWKIILVNALKSAKKKLVIVLFTPLNGGDRTEEYFEYTEENKKAGINVPTLSLPMDSFFDTIEPYAYNVDQQAMMTDTKLGMETVFSIKIKQK
jgi:hypothetical protein